MAFRKLRRNSAGRPRALRTAGHGCDETATIRPICGIGDPQLNGLDVATFPHMSRDPLDIVLFGDPILRRVATPVAAVTDEIRELVDAMFVTMDAAPGQGLAAPQVGRAERLCVVDVEGYRKALVNPYVVERSGKQRLDDGCLSLPGIYTTVERAARVVVEAQDVEGRPMRVEAEGALAFCLQHEVDHLEGRLFFDHLGLLKRRAVLAEWERERAKYPDGVWHVRARRVRR